MSGRLNLERCVCAPFIHGDDKGMNRSLRETEYQVGADHQTLSFPNLETSGGRCPSDLENVHPGKLPSAGECHRDSVEHRQMLPAVGGSLPLALSQGRRQAPAPGAEAASTDPPSLMGGCFSG